MQKAPYCAAMALVGSRELSRNDPERYAEWILIFQSKVKAVASIHLNVKYYFLGDYVYIDSVNLNDLLNNIEGLQAALLKQRVYVKGVVSNGTTGLEPIPIEVDESKSDEEKVHLKNNLFGAQFADKSYHLRPEIEELRSIGCNIHLKKDSSICHDVQTFKNISIHSNSNRFSIIKDIVRPLDLMTSNDLLDIAEDFLYFASLSKSLAKYFISLFVNISISLANLKHEEDFLEKFFRILSSEHFVSEGLRVIGFEYVVFSIFNSLCIQVDSSDNKNEKLLPLKSSCETNIFKRVKLRDFILEVPDFILTQANRNNLSIGFAKRKSLLFQNSKPSRSNKA